jgi:hypothetical protein
MLAWCSDYSEEGNARHRRRKEERRVCKKDVLVASSV